MIKVVLFDIDGTLIDSSEANWRFHNFLNKKYDGRLLVLEEYKKNFYALCAKNVLPKTHRQRIG